MNPTQMATTEVQVIGGTTRPIAADRRLELKNASVVLIIVIHIFLGLIFRQAPMLATPYAYAVIALGIFWAVTKPPVYAAYIASYVIGAEVLWRMLNAGVFWEGGKYAVILTLGLSLLHHRRKHMPSLPFYYFLLLLPSILLTLGVVGLSTARDYISFNLSGPLALFMSAWFFSGMKINRDQLMKVLLALAAPILTIATYALLTTANAGQIRWVDDSMFATSGGFGPNQVSAIMGLGVVAVWLLLTLGQFSWPAGIALIVVGLVMLLQGLLTFSRGGMYAAIIVVGFSALHLTRDRDQRLRVTLLLIFTVSSVAYVALPALNDYTGGFLETRFSDTNLSHRDDIMQEELQLFQENILAGVGPGVGNVYRDAAAHTEFTRLLAEHGLLGTLAFLILISMSLQRYFAGKTAPIRGLSGSFGLWSLIVMTNAAMRLAAVSYMFGLAFAEFDLDAGD
jgi:hypothetical protein